MHECSPSLESPIISQDRKPLGPVISKKVVTTDAPLTGWGAVFEGRTVRGVWSPALREEHIYFRELLTVFLALRHSVQFLKNHYVLVRMDNTTVIAYIKRQGSVPQTSHVSEEAGNVVQHEPPVIVRDACSRNNE